jgi:hypothetical protein
VRLYQGRTLYLSGEELALRDHIYYNEINDDFVRSRVVLPGQRDGLCNLSGKKDFPLRSK